MAGKERYLQIEAPDTKAVVDFLSAKVLVEVVVEGERVFIRAKASHGEESSTWDQHDFEFDLPELEEDDD